MEEILKGQGTKKSIQGIEYNSRYKQLNLRDALVAFVLDRHNFENKRLCLRSSTPYLCHHCRLPLRLATKKKNCTSCNLVTYCSDICRQKDKTHYESRLCRAFRNKDFKPTKSLDEFRKARLKQLRELLHFDKSVGGITQSEKNIILYQRFCHNCFATPTKGRNIKACPRCERGGFCSKECESNAREFHDRVCKDWSISTRCEQLMCRRFGQPLVWIPSVVQQTFVKPPESWNEYFRMREAPAFDACARAMITESLSIPMSALYAASKFLNLESGRSKLVIHFVGSSDKEAMFPFIYEEILNFIPSLKQLHIVLLGPEISSHDSVLLKSCSDQNREIVVRSIRTSYETFKIDDGAEGSSMPDLIVCCNSGIHYTSKEIRYIEDQCTPLKESWEPALKRMFQMFHVPLVFTSFNDWEIEQDFQRLLDLSAETKDLELSVLMKPKLNPYRSLHYKMDPWRSHSSFSANHCIFVCVSSATN